MFKNRSKLAFASSVVATLYVFYICGYFLDASVTAGGTIAFVIVMPHIVANVIAVIFNWIGFFGNYKWSVIVALVLYCVALVLFIPYFIFDLPSIILTAISISKISKINRIVDKK